MKDPSNHAEGTGQFVAGNKAASHGGEILCMRTCRAELRTEIKGNDLRRIFRKLRDLALKGNLAAIDRYLAIACGTFQDMQNEEKLKELQTAIHLKDEEMGRAA